MQADVQQLYHSPVCSVHNFLCRCHDCNVSAKEHATEFTIAYIRRGNFQFRVFRNDLDAYNGQFLVCKPGYEHRVGHAHALPDECTIFRFSDENAELLRAQSPEFRWFFDNPDIQSVLVKASPEMEYLHYTIFTALQKQHYPRLWIEQLMTDLFALVLSSEMKNMPALKARQKKNYLPLIETVKHYINENFMEDISLPQLAATGNMSMFHFNRLFRQLTGYSPYQYLLQVRLKEASIQLSYMGLPITSVAFSAGFNSLEHFSAAYKKQFGQAPSATRSKNSNFP